MQTCTSGVVASMADVVMFPLAPAEPSPLADSPTDPRSVIVDLEHEIAELQYVVATQAMELRGRATNRNDARRLRNSALFLALVIWWVAFPKPLDNVPAVADDTVAVQSSKCTLTDTGFARGFSRRVPG